MSLDSLSDDLCRSTVKTEETAARPSELAAFVDSIARVLTHGDFKDISHLSGKNIIGMNRAIVINSYLETNYNFRVKEIDLLIKDKMSRVMSLNGVGGKRLIDLFNAIQPEINAHTENEEKTSRLLR